MISFEIAVEKHLTGFTTTLLWIGEFQMVRRALTVGKEGTTDNIL